MTTPVDQNCLALDLALALDLELCPKTGRLLAAGWVWGGHSHQVGQDGLGEVLQQLRSAQAAGATLVGHNIRHFDLPHLWQLAQGQPSAQVTEEARNRWPEVFAGPVLDTLELSALLWPGQPTHKLDKLYRQQSATNDPTADAQETLERLAQAQAELLAHPLRPALRYWLRLLPKGPLRQLLGSDKPNGKPPSHIEAASDLLEGLTLQGLAPEAAQRLWRHLESLNAAQQGNLEQGNLEQGNLVEQGNLGALVALHWLLRRHQPSHRRPAWAAAQWPSFGKTEALTLGEADFSEEALRAELREIYGSEYDFRPGQLEMVQATLRGEVVPLGLLPTGGGKSLTFQFPALLLSRRERALTVILSPLVALMEDQVISLQASLPAYAERAAYLTGTQSFDEQRSVLEGVWEGRIDLLYLSPERLRNPGMQRLLRHRRPALWVLDEVHTLSQWGMDFRPDFLRVAAHIAQVHTGGPPPLLTLLTATATARVLDDLQEHLLRPLEPVLGQRPLLRLPKEQPSPWRSNIEIQMLRLAPEERLSAARADLLAHLGEGRVSIIYVRSRKLAEEYAQDLSAGGLRAAVFHAKIAATDKREVLRQFKEGELDVVVATSAFGMGIDRPGIHTVIHMGPPNTAESYLQEIGRVARKPGEQGRALLYWDERDFVSTLRQDAEVRIGGDSLRKCWDEAKKCLVRPTEQRWLSSQSFEKPLGISHPEDLLTQTRVALRALEAYGLLQEGQQQSAELLLSLKERSFSVLGTEGSRLRQWIEASQGWQVGAELTLNIMETSLLSGLSPQAILSAARQLVAAGEAEWSYRVTVRFRPKRRTRLELVRVSLRTLLGQWEAMGVDEEALQSIDAEAVQANLWAQNKQASFELARLGLRVLGLAYARKNGPRWSLTPLKGAPPLAEWEGLVRARLEEISRIWNALMVREELDSDTLSLNMRELDALSSAESLDFGPLESLLALEGLGILDLARGDEAAAHIFRLERGQASRYGEAAFRPLKHHYADRTRRIHVMRLLVQQPETERQRFIEDYFGLPLEVFCEKYHPSNPDELTVAQLPGTRQQVLDGLNEVQRQVVEDSQSRALLVLAGPGSGKTRTIVHRTAALLALENVPPEQILILAYNRTAVAEVRGRLGALLSPLGLSYRPLVLTFHGLARHLTGLRATDAPATPGPAHEKSERDNRWLLEQLTEYLRENDVAFRYLLVDEYQDIDQQKYDIIRLLTDFKGAGSEEDEAEQQSYLVAVGDDDQNIYGFQGANIRYIQQFRQDYQLEEQHELCLTQNYRSSPEIVAFANAFIGSALPPDDRLKGPAQRVVSQVEESGQVGFCHFEQPYAAAYTLARKIRQLHQGGLELHDMAVLAPTWNDLYAVQDALRRQGLPSQYFNTSDDLRPAEGLLGRHIIAQLENAPSSLCKNPDAVLGDLCAPYSQQDRSYGALQAALHGLSETTFEMMAARLRGARPLRRGAVALSTFHSAKGSEFEQVFVLDTGKDQRGPDPIKRADATRALYVALTRARRRLFVLSKKAAGHPTFGPEWLRKHLGLEEVAPAATPPAPPTHVRFTLELAPRDLMLSAAQVISPQGRAQVERYARQWGPLTLRGRAVYGAGGVVAVLSNKQVDSLEALKRRGAKVRSLEALQVFYCERDNNWYKDNYHGPEQGHFLVLPSLELEMPLHEAATPF